MAVIVEDRLAGGVFVIESLGDIVGEKENLVEKSLHGRAVWSSKQMTISVSRVGHPARRL